MNTRRLMYFLAFVAVIGYVMFFINSCSSKNDWKNKTSPLPKETVNNLCSKLMLNKNNHLCDGSDDVYALDFTETLREHFNLEDSMETPKSQAAITYEEVQTILGEYGQGCQDAIYIPSENQSYFRCFYDLRGDGFWVNAFYFYSPENTLFSIRSSSMDD